MDDKTLEQSQGGSPTFAKMNLEAGSAGGVVVDEVSPFVAPATQLFGTLDIDGVGEFYVFARQTRSRTHWVLTDKTIFTSADVDNKKVSSEQVIAHISTKSSGGMVGNGKTYLLARLLDNINVMVGRAAAANAVESNFYLSGEYRDEKTGSLIIFQATPGGRFYTKIDMVYEGYRLSVSNYNRTFPFSLKDKMYPVEGEKSNAAVIAGLGVKTFALLKKQMKDALNWYDRKEYKLIQTDEEFRVMMLAFLNAVQSAHDSKQAILVGLDTETTGLNVFSLEPNNPYRDHIVAIPFGWENDKGFVICTDMYYFGNVSEEEVYPIFNLLFRRNDDYSSQDIELDYCGQHFSFNRRSIMLVGANAGFDIRAFKQHDCDIYFDEDIQIMHYIFATDWVQGKNSLKYMTHRYLGDQTLELEDLFGPQHKDKYRYLSDPELAIVYGGADADYPRLLWKKFRRMMPDNLYAMYKKYDITALYRTSRATWLGMPVNTKAVREQGEEILHDLETLKDFIYRYAYAANRGSLEKKANQLRTLLGMASIEEIEDAGNAEGMYRYKFTPANHKELLYNVLGYPVLKVNEKSGEPALDKYVLKKLSSRKRGEPIEFLKEDIVSSADSSNVLISKDEFNTDMYPLARVFLKYAEINKEYTAYYKPITENDLEGRMFYTFSLQRAATRRILSPGQTMKGKLKKLVVAPKGKLFMCFDASQIEYRHMASLAYVQTKALLQKKFPKDWEKHLEAAGISRIHQMMHNAEADYHIETASMMTGLPQYQIDHGTRKMYKSIGFGIPYGLGDQSMCESLFGKVTKENMEKTKETLKDYRNKQSEIIRLLESVRDSAFVPATTSQELRDMLGLDEKTHVGIVKNFVGFYRLFILEKLTRARTGRIRRQAGNCIIQGGAAELFRRMLYNFYEGCVAAGISKKVEWLMLVHDEVDTIVDDDIDVCKLLEVIQSSCTLRYKDHIPYYVGIGLGYNWKEAKDDSAELPVFMVDRIIEAYRAGKFSIPCDGHQPEHLAALKRHYLCDRIGEVLAEIVPGIGPGFEWTEELANHVSDVFTNYMVRGYLAEFVKKEDKAKFGKNIPLQVQLQRWQEAREEYGFGVDFLKEKMVDIKEELTSLELSNMLLDSGESDFLLEDVTSDGGSEDEVSLLSDSDDIDISLLDQEESQWIGEDMLFDYSVREEDRIVEGASEGYKYFNEKNQSDEEDYELNPNPTSAFDLFISNKYSRKCVLCSGTDTFSVMLSGTPYASQVNTLCRVLKKELGSGGNTFIVIGDSIRKVTGIGGTAEQLDKIDKLLCGVPTD